MLVEYDDVEWRRREWIIPHRDLQFSLFLIEKNLYWVDRQDPRHSNSLVSIDQHCNNNNQHRLNGRSIRSTSTTNNTINWPAIVSIYI